MTDDHLMHFPQSTASDAQPADVVLAEPGTQFAVPFQPSFWHPFITAFFALPIFLVCMAFLATLLGWVYIGATIYSCIAIGDWAGLGREARRLGRALLHLAGLAAVTVPLYGAAPPGHPFIVLGVASVALAFFLVRYLWKDLLGGPAGNSLSGPERSYLLSVVPALALSFAHPLLGLLVLTAFAVGSLRRFEVTLERAHMLLLLYLGQAPVGFLALFQPAPSGVSEQQRRQARLRNVLAFIPLGFVGAVMIPADLTSEALFAGAAAWLAAPVLTLAVFAASLNVRRRPTRARRRPQVRQERSWDATVRDLREGRNHA